MIGRCVILNMLIVPSIINQRFLPRATIESAHMRKSIVCVTYFDTLYLNKNKYFRKCSKSIVFSVTSCAHLFKTLLCIVFGASMQFQMCMESQHSLLAGGYLKITTAHTGFCHIASPGTTRCDIPLLLLVATKLLRCHYSGKCLQNNGVSGCRMVFLYQLTASIAE